MLVRGQTTEDRIAQIAQGFGQGFANFNQARNQNEQRALLQQNQQLKSQELQQEALRRQEAMSRQDEQLGLEKRRVDIAEKTLGLNARNASLFPKLSDEQKIDLKIKKEREAEEIKRQDPVNKLEKLGAEGRGKVGALASGLQAIDQMTKASKDGFGPEYVDSNTPIIGGMVSDTPYSEAERVAAEVTGRLQSGGAMSENEVKTFKSLGPRPGDDAKARERKLLAQRDFLNNKLTAFSMSGGDLDKLGFKTTSDYSPRSQVKQSVNTQQSAPKVNPDAVKQIKSMSDEELRRFVEGR